MKWTWNCLGCRLLTGSIMTGVMMLGACTAPSSRTGGFESNNPATLLYAIQEAGEKKDRTKIPRLVESLENDDPAVRMMAIAALERITGQRLGYQPYASLVVRASAVARWQTQVRDGQSLQPEVQIDADTNAAADTDANTKLDINTDAAAVVQ